MKRLLIALLGLLLLSSAARAQTNPCNNYNQLKSAAISISTATTTALITNTDTSKSVLVCSWNIVIQGVVTTANTLLVEYGTGATCGTGTTALSGAMPGNVTAGVPTVNIEDYPTLAILPAGNNLCGVTTQAGVVAGFLTYILQ